MSNKFNFFDSAREIDIDGRLRVSQSNISKEGVNPYYGYEIPNFKALGLDESKVYYLYRPADELKKSAETFNGVQIVDKHIPMYADSPNKELVIGATGTDAIFESPYLKNSLFFWDSEAIAKIEAADKGLGGSKELSCGYAFDALMEPGEFEGQRYDGKMINIIGNHVALVDNGRAGSDVKVSDFNIFKDERNMTKQTIKTKFLEKLKNIRNIKAMDEFSPEQVESIVGTLLDVVEENNSKEVTKDMYNEEINKNPEPQVKDEENDDQLKALLKSKGYSDEEIAKICGYVKDKSMDEEGKEDEKDKEEKMEKAMDSMKKELRRELYKEIKQQFKSLSDAKDDVRDIVGDSFNCDTAEEIYRLALDEMSIGHKNINELSALKALVDLGKSKKNSVSYSPSHANDSSNFISNVESLVPSLKRIKV